MQENSKKIYIDVEYDDCNEKCHIVANEDGLKQLIQSAEIALSEGNAACKVDPRNEVTGIKKVDDSHFERSDYEESDWFVKTFFYTIWAILFFVVFLIGVGLWTVVTWIF